MSKPGLENSKAVDVTLWMPVLQRLRNNLAHGETGHFKKTKHNISKQQNPRRLLGFQHESLCY